MILNLIGALLNIVASLARHAERKQLMDAGAAKKTLNDLHASKKTIQAAKAAARATKLDPDSLRRDKSNRDKHGM